MAELHRATIYFILSLLFHCFYPANSQSFIGVNYGELADNLPSPAAAVKLLQSTSIEKVRLYGASPSILQAFANSGLSMVIGTTNGEIPSLNDPTVAKQWISNNVLPYYPSTNIIVITAGNEILTSGDRNLISQLLPAMQNLQDALASFSLADKIKISTVHSMAILQNSEPPSSGTFKENFEGVEATKPLLGFLQKTGAPLLINPYPYFAYKSDPRPETLAFCLFQDNPGRFDAGTKINYKNMFDAQVDAVHSALGAAGFGDVEIVVAETGWPYKGDPDEVGVNVENAKGYNGGLIQHLRSMVGTPLMPGKSVDTYLFALFDEDLKSGPTSERSFGLFKTDLTATYDAGLAKTSQSAPPNVIAPPTQGKPMGWCVPKAGTADSALQENLDYACGQGIGCSAIQPGGACFMPNTVATHAAFAMNLLYQNSEKNPSDCDFKQTATLSSKNPSYGTCIYTGS